MTQTFIHRISNLDQYNPDNKIIIWEDPSENRWGPSGVYSKLNPGDNAIFITDKKQKKSVLVGKVKSIEEKKGLTCEDILELDCSNDQLLSINAILPEKISQTKANFQPFIHPENLNIEEIVRDIENKNFINFHILLISKYHDIKESFKPNDRIVLINNENTLENARIYDSGKDITEQEEIPLSVKGLTLNQILDINKIEKKDNERSYNIKRINDIISSISSQGYYRFNGFWGFYDSLINKLTYSNKQNKPINKIIVGKGNRFYKISMPRDHFSNDYFNILKEKHLISIGGDCAPMARSSIPQHQIFRNLKHGDYFYLCRGNDAFSFIGKITSAQWENSTTKPGWIERSYELITESVKTGGYIGQKKWWTPNFNSTIAPITDIALANNLIFKPFFNSEVTYGANMNKYIELLKSCKNIILTGAPGTGKTYLAKELIAKTIASEENITFVQFHPSYDYTDFIEGLRPVHKNGNIVFELKNGTFKEFCRRAKENNEENFVFIIDEINRGEISKIFGELFFSIEPSYRGEEKGKVKTQYANIQTDDTAFINKDDDFFYIPDNVYIIGTMNDIDRSVESFDFAMRRRFTWLEITADESAENMKLSEVSKQKMKAINNVIANIGGLGKAYHIGASYFLDENIGFESIWTFHLEPLICEYLRGMSDIETHLSDIKKAYESA